MNFEQNNSDVSQSRQAEQQSSLSNSGSTQSVSPATKSGGRRSGWRIFWGIVMALSIVANIVLFIGLLGLVAVFGIGRGDLFVEEVIQEGTRTTKIAVVNLSGIIDNSEADEIHRQLKSTRKDENVKGLIIRINSPGGMVSASDRIYNEILNYRLETDEPVVAFMQGTAASGGYYASVACEEIIAEPTAITGSIGVIMGHFVFEQLLEEKLGIHPVIIKSGIKKDWPSPFHPITPEQEQYLQDKLITPAYERFVKIVDAGRASLSSAEVNHLADGSIYTAQEALDEKLIDQVGYLDEAIELVSSLAGVEKPHVVEYRKPFSFADFLTSQSSSILKFDRTTLYELSTPQLLYLWNLY